MLTVDPSHVAHAGLNTGRLPADLAIIVPTYNEAANVHVLIEKLEAALLGHAWEVIFVDDDSPDQTAAIAHRIGRTKPYVRCVQRIGRRGLSSAVIDGILSTNAPFVAVMDADLQHDESILVPMLRVLENNEADLVVGSRYVDGGGVGEWSKSRRLISRAATAMSNLIIQAHVSDPMSGYFMLPRTVFMTTCRSLSGNGYKILFDFLASAPDALRVKEVPFCFRPRLNGESKLDMSVIAEHAMLLLSKSIGRHVPAQAVLLTLLVVGAVFTHLGVLLGILPWMGFNVAQLIASLTILTAGYLIPMLGRRRESDRGAFFAGLLAFYVIASVGLIGNLSLSGIIFAHTQNWWIAGGAGAAVSTVWSYMHRTAATATRQ
jgi:dolichol-phosphate mannosyltransferase